MGFEERQQAIGLVLGLITFVAYWAVVIVRAGGDDLPFTQVAWEGPLLAALIVGGGVYGVVYAVGRLRARGDRLADARDAEIAAHAERAGGSLTGLAVLATLILLALDVEEFWPAHVLFVGAFLGSLVTGGVSLAAYREGIQR